MSADASEKTPIGPFRIEYILGTAFVLYESELPSLRLRYCQELWIRGIKRRPFLRASLIVFPVDPRTAHP